MAKLSGFREPDLGRPAGWVFSSEIASADGEPSSYERMN